MVWKNSIILFLVKNNNIILKICAQTINYKGSV